MVSSTHYWNVLLNVSHITSISCSRIYQACFCPLDLMWPKFQCHLHAYMPTLFFYSQPPPFVAAQPIPWLSLLPTASFLLLILSRLSSPFGQERKEGGKVEKGREMEDKVAERQGRWKKERKGNNVSPLSYLTPPGTYFVVSPPQPGDGSLVRHASQF